jgi:DNA-binding SARP family transcriptional activator
MDEFVSREVLVDLLWPENPPPSARQTVESYVSRLRRALRTAGIDGDLIESGQPGYRFSLNGHRFDRDTFEDLTRDGRDALARGDGEEAVRRGRAALELWRGPALAGLADQPGLRAEAAALEERRIQVLEAWAEAEMSLGRHAEAIATLRAEAERHPAREDLTRLLMLALYREGRQADALEAYRGRAATWWTSSGWNRGRRSGSWNGRSCARIRRWLRPPSALTACPRLAPRPSRSRPDGVVAGAEALRRSRPSRSRRARLGCWRS